LREGPALSFVEGPGEGYSIMEHNDIRHRLSEFIDGSVTSEERAAIEAHLKTCLPCSSALEELRKTIGHVKALEEIEPPAWMTQKVMAKVRAEAEEKKGLFERLFYPLSIKLPVQAIAVLFLAVTGFYIYQNLQPTERVTEAPIRESEAKKQSAPADTAQDKIAKAEGPALRSNQVPQTPAYKTLDMKQEYGTPPPPMLEGRTAEPAPVPAQPAEPQLLKDNKITEKHADDTPSVAAQSRPQKKTAPATDAQVQNEGKREPASLNRMSRALTADGGAGSESARSETTLTVSVKNVNDAAENIEAMVKEFDGTIVATQRLDGKRIYTLSLNASHANDLVEKLKLMGVLKEKDVVLEPRESRMVFRIELNRRKAAAAVGC
jgi:Predicted integral membrane protein (DUF2275)/Putative zinc-finger